MKFAEISTMTEHELKTHEAQAGEQLFRLRFQKSLGNAEGTTKLRSLRKDIARIKTAVRQRTLGLAAAITETAAPVKKSRKAKKDA